MSCAMIPLRSEANLGKPLPSLRLVLIRIVCTGVWTNSIVDQRIVFCLKKTYLLEFLFLLNLTIFECLVGLEKNAHLY